MILPHTPQDFRMSFYHLPYRKEKGPQNMAADMWVLEKTALWGGPVLRRYGWARRQITFGYGQKADWVERETGVPISQLTRRPTGGGVVRHGTDLTYCITFPRESCGGQMPPMELYGQVHQRWGDALLEYGIGNSLMPCPAQSKGGIPGDCFNEPVGRDLMDEGRIRKLGGAAMKRTRAGVLMQGTLELGRWPDLPHQEVEEKFLQLLAADFQEDIKPKDWPKEMEVERSPWVHTYASVEWTQNRKAPQA